MDDLAKNVDFGECYNSKIKIEVSVEIPEFECVTDSELSDFCKSVGIEAAFSPKANFSGAVTDEKLHIDSIIQKAKIKVDRAGTKAAAATAMTLCLGLPPQLITVYLDRPFIYAIINSE